MLLAIIDVYLIDRFIPPLTVFESPWNNVGYALIAIGIAIALWCALQFFKHKTTIHPGHTPTSLITTGIYGFSRNPIYFAMAIIIVGCCIQTGNIVTFPIVLIFVGIITVLFIEPEEAILRSQFASDYDAYTQSTRRWI